MKSAALPLFLVASQLLGMTCALEETEQKQKWNIRRKLNNLPPPPWADYYHPPPPPWQGYGQQHMGHYGYQEPYVNVPTERPTPHPTPNPTDRPTPYPTKANNPYNPLPYNPHPYYNPNPYNHHPYNHHPYYGSPTHSYGYGSTHEPSEDPTTSPQPTETFAPSEEPTETPAPSEEPTETPAPSEETEPSGSPSENPLLTIGKCNWTRFGSCAEFINKNSQFVCFLLLLFCHFKMQL